VYLAEREILKTIKAEIARANRIDLAVAYWGKSAVSKIELDKSQSPIRILCDLESGLCNPYELKLLLKSNVQIRALTKLHAKVYWTPNGVVVGSANASTNGLGLEDTDGAGLIEAALHSSERKIIDDVNRWFEKMWGVAGPNNVDEKTLARIKPLWKERRGLRPFQPSTKSLFETLIADSSFFEDRPIRLIAYRYTDESEAAKKNYAKRKDELFSQRDQGKYIKSGTNPFYEAYTDWPVSPGEYFVDCEIVDVGAHGKIAYCGLWKVRTDRWKESLGDMHWMFYADNVDDAFGRKFTRKDQSYVRKLLKAYFRRQGLPAADNHDCIFDIPLSAVPKEIGTL
jgi:hypothetical protein